MKNIKYFVGAVCLALSLNSCSDFLNEEPVSESRQVICGRLPVTLRLV